MEKNVLISREQDAEFRNFDDVEDSIPGDKMITVKDIRRKYSDRLNLSGDMICLINGSPKGDEYVLQDGDRAFFKASTKARGR
jgi:hypothetical protein